MDAADTSPSERDPRLYSVLPREIRVIALHGPLPTERKGPQRIPCCVLMTQGASLCAR
jgi:hypothetical protein